MDIFFQVFILSAFKLISCALILVPGRKVPLAHFNGLPVQHKDMVRAPVDEIAVMGYQDKAFFACKVVRHFFPGADIEMIGRLIDQKESVFLQKERGKERFCLLAKA